MIESVFDMGEHLISHLYPQAVQSYHKPELEPNPVLSYSDLVNELTLYLMVIFTIVLRCLKCLLLAIQEDFDRAADGLKKLFIP